MRVRPRMEDDKRISVLDLEDLREAFRLAAPEQHIEGADRADYAALFLRMKPAWRRQKHRTWPVAGLRILVCGTICLEYQPVLIM